MKIQFNKKELIRFILEIIFVVVISYLLTKYVIVKKYFPDEKGFNNQKQYQKLIEKCKEEGGTTLINYWDNGKIRDVSCAIRNEK